MIKFLLARSSAKQKGSRFPAPFLLRAGAEGTQRQRHCTNATPIFFPEKENGRRPSKRKAFPIASEQLEELQCLPIALPIARRCRVGIAIRFASASIIRCRSADLIEVRSNFRLPPVSTMRRALAMPHSARSLPPSNRHSRLTIVRRGCKTVTIRRDSWRSHVHRTYIAQRVQSFKLQTANVRGQGARPLAFLWGFQRGYSLWKENTPFVCSCRLQAASHVTF